MKPTKTNLLALIYTVTLTIFTIQAVLAQTVTRLTPYQGDDITPTWDPRGVNIVYIREKVIGQAIFDAYKVESSGQADEQPLLTGLSTPFGVATTTSWIGNTGFLAFEEAISGFEVLKFDVSQAPFDRTIANGSDAANTLLLSINGGGGGGMSKISRDGLVALERFSSSGSAGNISIRAGLVSSMVGQASSTFGTPLIATASGSSLYSNGGALNPNGSEFIISSDIGNGTDLILGSTSGAFSNTNLTNDGSSGVMNVFPDISPDGQVVVFARSTPLSNGMYDLYTVNIDGTGLTQVTNTPNFSENRPSWSPDGGSVAFDGAHLDGHESESPALEAGETANYNIYILTLPPANTVTPKTKLTDPPLVIVDNHKATFKLAPFLKAQITPGTQNLVLPLLGSSGKTTFSYEVEVSKNGTKGTYAKLTSKKNSVAAKNLKPGTYKAKYRVKITNKKKSKPDVVKLTKFSPKATFQIE